VQLNTNMVLLKIAPATATALAAQLRRSDVLVLPRAPMRLVTHLDVDAAAIDRALAGFRSFFARAAQLG
jgi:threonine aldolase